MDIFPGRTFLRRARRAALFSVLLLAVCVTGALAQGPAPETAPPLFPGGALVSYNSIFQTRARTQANIASTSLPTFSHEGDFHFTWGFHSNFDLALVLPVVTNHFQSAGEATVGG